MSKLTTLVNQILESHQEMSQRMARIEQQGFGQSSSRIPTITGRDATPSPSVFETYSTYDSDSVLTIKGVISDSESGRNSELIRTFGHAFDQDLNTSRPYTRARKRHTILSTASSEIHTMGWSCLSGLSLAEVSHISVINLPICPCDLWNGQRYHASRTDDSLTGFLLSKGPSSLTI